MEFNNQYLTFQDYRVLGGKLPEMPFNILEFKARKQVDEATLGRLKKLTDYNNEVKMCMYELINTLSDSLASSENNNKNISSETYPGYSVTYQSFDEGVLKTKQNEIRGIIENYLSGCITPDGVHYLYRGVDKLC